ncbi:MAG: hypothetical protein ABJN84_03435 [Flavobacteriaceae bacterium]
MLAELSYAIEKIEVQIAASGGQFSTTENKEEAKLSFELVAQADRDLEKNDGFSITKSGEGYTLEF